MAKYEQRGHKSMVYIRVWPKVRCDRIRHRSDALCRTLPVSGGERGEVESLERRKRADDVKPVVFCLIDGVAVQSKTAKFWKFRKLID